jgi:hypothetical protein
VGGSGDTTLAAYANGAIRSGNDAFLQSLALSRGARFLVVGNLVSRELREDELSRHPLISAEAEIRVLETHAGGDLVVSDLAASSTARSGRSLEIVDPPVMRAAAARAAAYVKDDMQGLLLGQAHPPLLVNASFNGVKQAWLRELRQGLGGLPTVQRFFRRGFSSGVFRADVILRGDEPAFLAQLLALRFKGFVLEQDKDVGPGTLVFTLRRTAGPAQQALPTPEGQD